MKIKKIVASSLVAGFIFLNAVPAISIESAEKTKMTRKEKKQLAQKESKMDYINLEWWQGFNDEYLNEYIIKAVENNHDLKIATLKVEEARQSVKAQFASELPSVYVGAAPAIVKMPGSTKSEGSFAIPIIASYEIDIFLKNRDKTKSIKKNVRSFKTE